MANTRKLPEDRRKSVNLSLCREARAALALRPGEASRWVDRLILAELKRERGRARKGAGADLEASIRAANTALAESMPQTQGGSGADWHKSLAALFESTPTAESSEEAIVPVIASSSV